MVVGASPSSGSGPRKQTETPSGRSASTHVAEDPLLDAVEVGVGAEVVAGVVEVDVDGPGAGRRLLDPVRHDGRRAGEGHVLDAGQVDDGPGGVALR